MKFDLEKNNLMLILVGLAVLTVPVFLLLYNDFTISNIYGLYTYLAFYLQNSLISFDSFISLFLSMALFLNGNTYSLLSAGLTTLSLLLIVIAILTKKEERYYSDSYYKLWKINESK